MLRAGIFALFVAIGGCVPGEDSDTSLSPVRIPSTIDGYCAQPGEDYDGAAGHYRALSPCDGSALPLLEVAVSDNRIAVPPRDTFVEFVAARSATDFAGSEILAERIEEDVFFIKMRDAVRDTPEGRSRDIWRAFMVIDERLVTLSLRHASAANDDTGDMAALRSALRAVQEAN